MKESSGSIIYEDIEELKGLFPAVLFIIYVIGYSYLKIYYGRFGVDFENYINLTDLMFFAINPVLFFVFYYGVLELVVYILFWMISQLVSILRGTKGSISKGVEYYFFNKSFYKSYNNLIYYFLITVAVLGVISSFPLPIEIGCFSLIAKFLPAVLFKIILGTLDRIENSTKKPLGLTDNQKVTGVLFLGLLVCVIGSVVQANIDSKNVKKGLSERMVKFNVEGLEVSTLKGDSKFIGETSNFIFIYNMKSKSTEIYSRSEILNFQIHSD
ncbi:hypothetical protein PBT90_16740 [Algoriphagus halophytocola]|uniref:hypothetical protein n=1 Tax=Algoriphagus halophytocola TaxID=2991499 RepID=UPI0022DD589A|nr:hypothetical protein [Algoriphagus sp. TR-M9]WBL42385.1 hypothetical protein PBT90_16740 [Algoriphagus sp. TR-M9]